MNKYCTIYLVRHGETDWNADGIIQGHSDIALNKNGEKQAEELSLKLVGKIPIIYSSDRMYAVAYKWKINFNETSKVHAFNDVFPELDHNEIVGFTKLNGNYHVIIIRDEQEYLKIKKVFSNTRLRVLEISLK